MKKLRGLSWALGLTALLGLTAREGRAETISITLSVTGAAAFDVDATTTPGADSYSVSPAGILAINGYLSTAGSEYRFGGLGGLSNFSSASNVAFMNVAGTLISVNGGNAGLTLTETEAGFTNPVSTPGAILRSSSTANTTQLTAAQTVSSAYSNAGPPAVSGTAGPYPVFAGASGSASTFVAPVNALYTLTNTVSFSLGGGSISNPVGLGFSATSILTAVPEPSALLTMLTGMPVPLIIAGWLRRRRASA